MICRLLLIVLVILMAMIILRARLLLQLAIILVIILLLRLVLLLADMLLHHPHLITILLLMLTMIIRQLARIDLVPHHQANVPCLLVVDMTVLLMKKILLDMIDVLEILTHALILLDHLDLVVEDLPHHQMFATKSLFDSLTTMKNFLCHKSL